MSSNQSPISVGSHQAPVYALGEGMTHEQVFTGGGDRVVALWDVTNHNQLPFAVRTDAPVYSLVLHKPTHQLFIGCSNGKLHAVDMQSKKEIFAWSLDANGIFDLKIDYARNRLLAAGGNGVLTVIDLSCMKVLRSIPLSQGKLRRLALRNQGDLVAVADNSGPVHVLEAEYYHSVHALSSHEEGATAVAWHPTKPVLISGGKDAYIRCYNLGDDYKQVLSLPAHQSTIYDIVYHETSDCFVSCSRDKSIKWWNPVTFDPLRRIGFADGGHKHSVNRLLALGRNIISASDDRGVLVFGA